MKSRLRKLTVEGRVIKRVLGCNVLLQRVENPYTRPAGLILTNQWTSDSIVFKVLSVGAGKWIKKGKKRIFVKPEVQVGEFCLSRHWLDAARHETKIEVLDHADGRGRVIVDCREILATWKPQ